MLPGRNTKRICLIFCRVFDYINVIIIEPVNGKEGVKVWNENECLERFLSNDQLAFEELIKHYQAYVFAVILNFVTANEAEDLAQEVFLQIYRSLPRYRPDNLKGWIGKIAANKAIDWKRRQARQNVGVPVDVAELKLESGIHPDDFLIQKENEQRIREICQSLPRCYGQTITSYYYHHQSYQQIADAEGISIKAVESRLYRARILIRQKWKEGNG